MRGQVGRGIRALVCGALLLGVFAGSAAAASPDTAGGGPYPTTGEKDPLTPAQQLIEQQKLAIANQEIAHPGFVSGGARSASLCPLSLVSVTRSGVAPANFCEGQYGFVATRAVEQQYCNWCGVATVQVVSNYAWGTGTSNEYTQAQINSNWNGLDACLPGQTRGTSTAAEVRALNGAVGGKLPAGFVYSGVIHNGVVTGPLTGSEWHGYVRTDLSPKYRMPQVVSVSPMDPNLPYVLSTWLAVNAPRQNAGHWIVIYAWYGVWDGTRAPTVAYDDSGIRRSGGVEGRDPAYDIYKMIKQYNPQHGTDGVVW